MDATKAQARAMAEAYRALVLSLVQSESIDPKVFGFEAEAAACRLAHGGDDEAAAAFGALVDPLLAQLRSLRKK